MSRKDDGWTPTYKSELIVSSADNVDTTPTIWALPGLLPCHHVSTIVGTTGVGLTQLAIQTCAHLAPKPTPRPLPDLRPSVSNPDLSILQSPISDLKSPISNLQSQISDPQSENDNQGSKTPSDPPLSPSPAEPAEVYQYESLPAVLFVGGREAAETLRARLAAAGADLRRILILTEVTDTDTVRGDQITRPLKVSDYKLIGEALREHKSIRLVLIDNAEDLFFDTNRIKKSRLLRQLACFRALAEMREVNVCLLANVPRLDNDPFRTTLLSTLREVCRTVHLLAPDLPQHNAPAPDPLSTNHSPLSTESHRLLFTIKNTLASTCPTLRLDLFPTGEACPNPSSIFNLPSSLFSPTLTYPRYLSFLRSAPTRGPKPVKLDYACQVLIELLREGPLPVGDIKRPAKGTIVKLTGEASIAWNTVQRAMATLNIQAKRIGKRWHWQLPDTIPHAEPAPAQLAQETPLSCPKNSTQPQPAQEDTQGRATPEIQPDDRHQNLAEPQTSPVAIDERSDDRGEAHAPADTAKETTLRAAA